MLFLRLLTFNLITLATHFLFWSIWVSAQRCAILPNHRLADINHISWKLAGTKVRILDIDAQTSVAHTTIVFTWLYPFSQAQTAIFVRFGIRGNAIPKDYIDKNQVNYRSIQRIRALSSEIIVFLLEKAHICDHDTI